MKKLCKILIIGDSNCIPRFSKSKKGMLPLEKTYIFMLKKRLKNFKKSKIIWIGIHSNRNINKERPNTFSSVSIFNEKLKKLFNENFIDNDFENFFFKRMATI